MKNMNTDETQRGKCKVEKRIITAPGEVRIIIIILANLGSIGFFC